MIIHIIQKSHLNKNMQNDKKYHKKGINRLFFAFINSYKGFMYIVKNEQAFQQELALFIILLPVIFIVDVSIVEKLLLFLTISFVLIVEVLNTAIETTINRISSESNKLSAIAKDLASFAVLFSIFLAGITWIVIFIN